MGWKELSEKLQDARIKKRISLKELSIKTNISMEKLRKMENGDFSIESPIYMKNYLKRLSMVLNLDDSELIEEYLSEKLPEPADEKEGVKFSFESIYYAVMIVLSVFVVSLLIEIEKELKAPYAIIYNTSENTIFVNDRKLPPDGTYTVFKNTLVTKNSSVVTIKEYSGRVLKIRIRNFEVSLHGKGKKP